MNPVSGNGDEKQGERQSREEQRPPKDGLGPHDDSSGRSPVRSFWLYASPDDIAAAVESHRAAIVESLRRYRRTRFSAATADEAFDRAVIDLFHYRPSAESPGPPLRRWLRRVAFHRATEVKRRCISEDLLSVLDEGLAPSVEPPDEGVIARAELQAVIGRVLRMRPEDRDVVLRVVQLELEREGAEHVAARLQRFLDSREQPDAELAYKRLSRSREVLRRFRSQLAGLALTGRAAPQIGSLAPVRVFTAVVSVAVASTVLAEPPNTSMAEGVRVSSGGDAPGTQQVRGSSTTETPTYSLGTSAVVRRRSAADGVQLEPTRAQEQSSGSRTPPLPGSASVVANHPAPSGPRPLLCVHNAGPVRSACIFYPDPSGILRATGPTPAPGG